MKMKTTRTTKEMMTRMKVPAVTMIVQRRAQKKENGEDLVK